MRPQGFLYTSHLVSQNVKKAYTQGLKFVKIDNYCFIAGIKWNAFCFVFNCKCMAVTNTMSTSTLYGSSFDIYYSASSFTHLCFQTPSVNTNTVKKEIMSYYYYENSFDFTYTLKKSLEDSMGSEDHILRTIATEYTMPKLEATDQNSIRQYE